MIRIGTMVFILFLSLYPMLSQQISIPDHFDWQGHRGARGLSPENTIPSFLKALEFPVTTLEIDVAVTKDSQIVLSHEPWMNPQICLMPDGSGIEDGKSLKIIEMSASEIKTYDCGSKKHPGYPQQVNRIAWKPTFEEFTLALKDQGVQPFLNIEIKSRTEWDDIFTPPIEDFVDLLIEEIDAFWSREKLYIQSFDIRPLQIIRRKHPDISLALLVDFNESPESKRTDLGFNPEILSPFHRLVSLELIEKMHSMNMKVIPWTVNDEQRMRELILLGVDGIITDYPDLIEKVGRK